MPIKKNKLEKCFFNGLIKRFHKAANVFIKSEKSFPNMKIITFFNKSLMDNILIKRSTKQIQLQKS